ncbi:hypothetical protein Tco_1553506, partial [Tanacetum coccineum]
IINPQETQQVAARDEKWVPSSERVKISSTNIKLETTVPQKEETFQVVIDIIKNSTCFKAFTISADVLEIFMQQFWYTIKKVQGTDPYKFLLANKKCTINAKVSRTILNICPRVEGVYITDFPYDDTALTFLIDLGYKGPLNRVNVDYPELIWKDFAYQIDHRKENVQNHNRCSLNTQQIRSHPRKAEGKSEPEPEPAKKKTFGKRRVKKKVTLSADDNIISDDPDVALELAKSISQTKVEEAEAARKVHSTHARIVTEFVPKSAKKKSCGRRSKSLVIQDTLSTSNSKLATSKSKLKGAPSLTPAEQEAINIMQALKDSKNTSRRQPGTRCLNEGSSEGTGAKPGFPNEDKDISEEKDDKDGDADDEGDDHVSDTQDADDEYLKTESDEDEIYKYKICVRKDEDVEMKDAKVKESDKGFGDQFLKLTSDSSLVGTAKDSADADKHMADLIHKYSLQHLLKLTKRPTPIAEQESEKSPSDILKIKKEQAEKQKRPQFTIKSSDMLALEENIANHRLYHALMEALIEDENAMDKGFADTVKDHKRKHDDNEDDDDEDPPAGPNQGSKTGKSAPAKEPVEEPIAEVIMDDVGDDVARDDNPPQDTSEPKTRKTLNLDWFKQPPRPPTTDPEWNKR